MGRGARRSRRSSGSTRTNAPAEFRGMAAQRFRRRRSQDTRGAGNCEGERQHFTSNSGSSSRTGRLRWLAGKGQVADGRDRRALLRGTFYAINERKQLEARLLAVNETLEARVGELREEARTLEVLNRTGIAIGAELDLERLVQIVTDAGVELSGAQFGAFFYNVIRARRRGLHALHAFRGAARSLRQFSDAAQHGNVRADFSRDGPVRSPDILADPRYGKSEPYKGMPPGHLPVRSYLAVPVLSRSGEVLGGLFFGHAQPGMFSERAERIMVGLAAQAAVAIDNARLYQTSLHEIAARKQAEEELQELNRTLEQRAESARSSSPPASSSWRKASGASGCWWKASPITRSSCSTRREGDQLESGRRSGSRATHREEIVGQHFSRFYTEEDRQNRRAPRALETAARTGKYEAEGWRVRKDGTRFWAGVVINAIRELARERHRFCQGHARPDRTPRRRRAASPVAEDGRHRPADRRRRS